MELQGLYKEETLNELHQNNEITILQYLFHNEEKRDAFESYCTNNNMQMDDKAASMYFDHLLKEEEYGHVEGMD